MVATNDLYACEPIPQYLRKPVLIELAKKYSAAHLIVEGSAIQISSSHEYPQKALVSVKQYIKGDGPNSLIIEGFGDSTACLIEVKPGENLIFFTRSVNNGPSQTPYWLITATYTPDWFESYILEEIKHLSKYFLSYTY